MTSAFALDFFRLRKFFDFIFCFRNSLRAITVFCYIGILRGCYAIFLI